MKRCSVHGDYVPVFVKSFDGKRDIALKCQICVEAGQVLPDENERLLSAGIPKKFLGASFKNFNRDDNSEACYKSIAGLTRNFETAKKLGTSAIFCGTPGTGKTHLAVALCSHLINHGHFVKYTTSYKMFSDIKSTYNNFSSEHEANVIGKYISCDLLVIDEVGVQFGSDAEKVLFFQVINGRYEDILPTIIISNEDSDGVKSFIGEGCFDRMMDNKGFVLSFDWESCRK